jgi:hypothetical protein
MKKKKEVKPKFPNFKQGMDLLLKDGCDNGVYKASHGKGSG